MLLHTKSTAIVLAAGLTLFAGERDQAISSAMQDMIAKNEIPGAVTVVTDRKGITHLGVTGFANAGKTKPLAKDSIFWIASMTKPITAVAVMMMQDEGKLSIEDPVSKYIPEFAAVQGKVTLRHMLTHTSGMGEATPDELNGAKTLADLVPIYAKKPLAFEPGSQWKYCQTGINMLARVVEVVSKQQFPEFLQARIFKPLGMKDTTFYLAEKQMPRLVTPARREGEGLIDAQIGLLQGKPATSTDRYPAANGGLFSTGPDYAAFARMMLNGGEWKGRRYLTKASYDLMTHSQTGSIKAGFIPGHGWGLGVGVVVDPQGQTAMNKPGTFGHGGAYGTQAWIDPGNGVALVLMVQRANFKNSDDSPVRLAFQQAALGGAAVAKPTE
jgi:CubicO group peptidase (beta-lactamase class C family)